MKLWGWWRKTPELPVPALPEITQSAIERRAEKRNARYETEYLETCAIADAKNGVALWSVLAVQEIAEHRKAKK